MFSSFNRNNMVHNSWCYMKSVLPSLSLIFLCKVFIYMYILLYVHGRLVSVIAPLYLLTILGYMGNSWESCTLPAYISQSCNSYLVHKNKWEISSWKSYLYVLLCHRLTDTVWILLYTRNKWDCLEIGCSTNLFK